MEKRRSNASFFASPKASLPAVPLCLRFFVIALTHEERKRVMAFVHLPFPY